jgi:hypothetical protein
VEGSQTPRNKSPNEWTDAQIQFGSRLRVNLFSKNIFENIKKNYVEYIHALLVRT